jgi:archaemetzincin
LKARAMKTLQLLPIGNVDDALLNHLCPAIEATLGISCQRMPLRLDPEFAFHGERQQYHSSEILYIPILTFVFGEAQMGGPCAVLSTNRLRQEFYGLPPDKNLFRQRVLKEAVHEVGHTLDLTHCDDYRCAMASSHAVEWIDLKENTFCHVCRRAALPGTQAAFAKIF